MKKLFLLLICSAAWAQTPSVPVTSVNNLKINNPIQGTLNDSVLVWRGTGDKIARWVKISDIVDKAVSEGGAGDLQATLTAGSTGFVGSDIIMVKEVASVLKGELAITDEGATLTTGNATIAAHDIYGQITALSNTTIFGGDLTTFSKPVEGVEAEESNQFPTLGQVNTLVGDFIPLSGTTEGNPVTGPVEFNDYNRLFAKSFIDTDVESSIAFDDGQMLISSNNTTSGYQAFIRVAANDGSTAGILVSSDDPDSKGISGAQDYTANITDLDYTQKKYVDDAINDAIGTSGFVPYSGATGNVNIGQYNFEARSVSINDVSGANKRVTIGYDAPTDTGTNYALLPPTGNVAQNIAYQSWVTNTAIPSYIQEWPETTYSQTVTWNSATPTGTITANWRATRVGKKVSVRINWKATTAVNNNNVFIPLPTGLPTPSPLTGWNTNDDYFGSATGFLITATNAVPGNARANLQKTASGYGVNIMSATTTAIGFITTFDYWID